MKKRDFVFCLLNFPYVFFLLQMLRSSTSSAILVGNFKYLYRDPRFSVVDCWNSVFRLTFFCLTDGDCTLLIAFHC